MDRATLAKYIDHTLLKADATEAQIRTLCAEAREHGFASVCVNPTWVALCAELLQGSGVAVCTVVGFPLGATTTAAKVAETRDVVAQGATEVDMVIHIAWAKGGRYDALEDEVRQIVAAAGTLVKVIIETCYLTDAEKEEVCRRCVAAGAQYVKTSTGFGPRGATAEDVALMKRVVGDAALVKAAGGIRTFDDAMAMIKAGASRIGASAGIAILAGLK